MSPQRRLPPGPPSYSSSSSAMKREPYHIIHKVPIGDSPYARAKHAQLVEKDPKRAIPFFWAAINAGDRIDSALKDMAVVMMQMERCDEGIEAIKTFRARCSFKSQDSIDKVLLELFKKSGRIEEEADLLEYKLKSLEQEMAFGGRAGRVKRVQGKHVSVTIEQELASILGNLGWVHLQLHNYGKAEQHYRRSLILVPDKKKLCNLAVCLMRMRRIPEAKSLINEVRDSSEDDIEFGDPPLQKCYNRALETLREIEAQARVGCSCANRMKENQPPGIVSPSFDKGKKEEKRLQEELQSLKI